MEDFERFPLGAEFKSSIIQGWLQKLGLRQNIDLLQELTSVADDDELAIFDASETGQNKTKKVTVSNLGAALGGTSLKIIYSNESLTIATNTQVTGHASLTFSGTGNLTIEGTGSLAIL